MLDAENWVMLGADVKGDIYEGLLEKNAEDTKSGAGQYFTPRALIKAMVECVRPKPEKTIADPAAGTGGFFLASYDFLLENYELDRDQKEFLKYHTFKGWEIVSNTARMALMNLFLHNIGDMNSEPPIVRNDSLNAEPSEKFDYVLANPPFGKKSSRWNAVQRSINLQPSRLLGNILKQAVELRSAHQRYAEVGCPGSCGFTG